VEADGHECEFWQQWMKQMRHLRMVNNAPSWKAICRGSLKKFTSASLHGSQQNGSHPISN
jgi:hypothetical protein